MITKADIAQKVIEVLAEMLHIEKERVRPESSLVEDMEMDSFNAVQLLFELEDQYGIEIPDEKATEFKLVQDIIEYVTNRLEQK